MEPIIVNASGQADVRCAYCKKPITKRQWIGFIDSSRQCSRLWCRLWSGHWLWMNFRRRIVWEKKTFSINYPTIRR